MSSSKRQTFTNNFIQTFFRQIGIGVISFISAVIIARVYGPVGNGMFALAILLPTLMGAVLNMGVASANVYFIGSNQMGINEAINNSFKIFIRLSLIGLFIGSAVILWYGEGFFPNVEPSLLWVALLIYPVMLLSGFVLSIFHGLQDFKTYNILLILQPVLFFCALCLLVFTGNKTIIYLVSIQLLSNLIALGLMLVKLNHLYRSQAVKETNKRSSFNDIISYGWKSNISSLLGFLNYKVDIFLINFLIHPAAAGIYVVSVALAEKLWLISTAVSTVILPRLSELSADEEKRKRLTPQVSRIVLFITLFSSLILALMSSYLVFYLFGVEYSEGILPLILLLPGIVILASARIWAIDIAARGKPEINMYISIITLIINIIGNFLLIPKFGLSGAAMATTLAYLVASVNTLIMYIRITKNNWSDALFVKPRDIMLLISLTRNKKERV